MKKKLIGLCMTILFLAAGLTVCAESTKSEDIIILYENDVHCAIDGYAKLSAMKKELSETHQHVGVVSVGDYIQGSSLGAVSQGEYIVKVMNQVGYDAVALGNHEFDFRLTRLLELVDMMDTKPVCSNLRKVEDNSSVFLPYTVKQYGDIDVAYIGITTPDTLVSSAPAQFKDADGNYTYTFSGTNLYDTVQASINDAQRNGAEYVIALSHLGVESVYEQWSAQALVKNTYGLDVVLDGHSHSVVEEMIVADKKGEEVVISSTGTQFANIGKLTISEVGIETELIPTESYEKADDEVTGLIAEIQAEYQEKGERKIGISKVDLTTVDENGNRIIRTTETNLGDFCADAFRVVTGADIGFMNGGGIRANISAGDVTFNDILSVFPWNNRVCVIEVTGQQIVDMLELAVLNHPNEDGTFQHVSGLTFEFDNSIPTPVILDENMNFVRIDGERRVSNVKVLNQETNQYEDISLNLKYDLASHNYLLLEQGGGATMFQGAKVISDKGMLDVELLEIYITDCLNGVIEEGYKESQNRIMLVLREEYDSEKENDFTEGSDTEVEDDFAEGNKKSPSTGDASKIAGSIMLWLCSCYVMLTIKCKRNHARK